MGKIKSARTYAIRGWKKFIKSVRRRERLRKIRAGYYYHQLTIKKNAEARGERYKPPKKSPFAHNKILPPKPELSNNYKFLAGIPELFSRRTYGKRDDGIFYLPEVFSLIDNYTESFDFLKRLYLVLYKGKCEHLILDYTKCNRIDVDASMCMDILLGDFIKYKERCNKLGHKDIWPTLIKPVNINKPHIIRILFSIGAYKNIKGLSFKFKDVEELPVLINSQKFHDTYEKSEVHQTQIVEYIKRCINRLGRELTQDAETEFYKVIGEVMNNAEEHATMPERYAIGFFQEIHNEQEHFGIFNFSIFNFGKSIYDTFKSDTCANPGVVKQMTELSEDYTKRGWISKAEFEEETLWTLYALQEGVTSKQKKRGNGSIQYLENFFKLKGDINKDNISKLVIVSGNTRILFDGNYPIIEKEKIGTNRKYKMITFNDSGNISDRPDKKYVSFAPHYFPGTMISARILIKFDNTNAQENGNQDI